MAITQAKFLGATVLSFNANAGWNEQSSTLSVSLAEDPAAGDRFTNPPAGTPVSFSADGFRFDGLVQHAGRASEAGGRKITVAVTDPREVLDAVRVVLNSLTADVPVPNLLNAYGYWERTLGFGGGLANEAGMLWHAPFEVLKLDPGGVGGFTITPAGDVGVRPAVEALTRGTNPILFRGTRFQVDFSGLPAPPPYYRVPAGYPTLLEIVSQLCQDAGHDFLVLLEGATIKFKTADRTRQPSLGAVAAYVNSRPDAVLKNYGTEMRNDVTNAVLVGGDVQELVQVVNVGGGDAVWPYWGLDNDGNVILGKGDPSVWHEADLNAREIADVIGDVKYHVTLPELRCAMSDTGFESWAFYVMKWYPDKAKTIGLANSVDSDSDLAELFPDGVFRRDLIAQRDEDLNRFGRMNEETYWTDRAQRVFDFVRRAAEEYFGKKFLVRVPFFVYWKTVPETFQVVSSMEVSDGGYLPETATPLGLAYYDVDRFQTEDGRFACFVEFDPDDSIDLQALSPDSAVVSNGKLYVRADVDDRIVYPPGSVYPCVVVTLAQPVYARPKDPLGGVEDIATIMKVDPSIVATAVAVRHGSFPVRVHPAPFRPTAVAVPMKDNRATYGPWGTFGRWGASGAPGKTWVERDEGLTPWNYGGWDAMNAAAAAKLAGAATNMQEGETGTVEVPGTPAVSIGDVLAAGGPNVTNIACNFSPSGVTTSYEMRTFTPVFGAFQRQNADRLRRLGIAAMQTRRALRLAMQRARDAASFRQTASAGMMANAANAVRQMSPYDTVYGTMTYSKKYGYRTQVSTATTDEFMANVRGDSQPVYWATGGMGLEGLYRPFSTARTKADAGDMPHFENVAVGVTSNAHTADTYDPVKDSDIDLLLSGKDYKDVTLHRLKPSGGRKVDYTQARGVGLRGPLVLVGWGAEVTGKPLPNQGDETKPLHQWQDQWLDKPAQHPEKWRAGPVDLKWDNWRKVWTVPTFLKGVLLTPLTSSTPAYVKVRVGSVDLPDQVLVYLDLAPGPIAAGKLVRAGYDPLENRWYVVGAQC